MSERLSDNRDEELDRILREVSDSADIPFSEEDWGEMKSRLDLDSRPAGLGWFAMGMAWLGSMGIALSIALLIWNSPKEIKGNTDISSTNGIESIESKNLNRESQIDENLELLSDSIKVSIPQQSLGFSESATSAEKMVVIVSEKENEYESNAETKIGITENKEVTQANSDEIPKSQNELGFSSEESDEKEIEEPIVVAEAEPDTVEEDFDQEKNKDKKERFGGKFNLSFQLAPDLSGVKLDQFGKAGNMIGIGAEYFVKPRLSISSGVFYSYKPYSANEGYMIGYGKQPNSVFGECDILDIPLNLRIYPFEGKVQRAFVGLGLSSYLMLSEYYELEYYGYGANDSYTQELEVKGKNNHFFGVANFSIGYERKLGKTLSIQVEPYFKVPLNGVGEGDISLKSTGLFVGLKFYPSGINIR
ncbi:hypothetical protein [Algoriphagus zhangzhouensis]|uniref:Outer membrane protein beta-barrel domain-containing protein n=1 Tax=Algoriphagus zhangzhouensis TaxID=1073327 RepID=A0A1M7ZIA9_9BACT|nr:hypothetical protein [Algoriphagus zhangzhouensis]TDY44326.1 hypothetical protein A8938_3539 [Algoriphagus zhangzhouensis]SHO64562.1 hypothetical protein SAMN04488108_3534 [Algoriphagus zhangzhouensis]